MKTQPSPQVRIRGNQHPVVIDGYSHVDPAALSLPKSLLDELVDGIALILEGKRVGQPEKTALGEGLRCDFGSTGITYRPDRL